MADSLEELALDALIAHTDRFWRPRKMDAWRPSERVLRGGIRITPMSELEPWVYLSVGAWVATGGKGKEGLEFMLLAPEEDDTLYLLLQEVVKEHHRRGTAGGLQHGDVVSLSRVWMEGSRCDRLLVLPPYPYGPGAEDASSETIQQRILWLMPIAAEEEAFLKEQGLEALEANMESKKANFLDPKRPLVV